MLIRFIASSTMTGVDDVAGSTACAGRIDPSPVSGAAGRVTPARA